MHYDLHVHTAEYSPCSGIPADDFNLFQFTNSDAHDAGSLGRYLNDFDADLRTIDQLIGYVKSLTRS